MDYRVTFEFNDMDVSKSEMRKELEYFEEHLADKYDADLYHIRIEPIDWYLLPLSHVGFSFNTPETDVNLSPVFICICISIHF